MVCGLLDLEVLVVEPLVLRSSMSAYDEPIPGSVFSWFPALVRRT
jgi:hypothetical protein